MVYNIHGQSEGSGVFFSTGGGTRIKQLSKTSNSLILSRLTYGVLLWGWKCQRVFGLQKKAVRILTNSNYNSHTNGLFKSLKLLKFHDISALHDLKFCYKRINYYSPEYFIDLLPLSPTEHHNYETRQVHRFRLPLVNHEFAKQSIK